MVQAIGTLDEARPAPELTFAVENAEPLRPAAAPTLAFDLRVQADGGWRVESVLLDVQLQIAARRRGYGPDEKPGLLELFGTPDRWGTTLRTLPWARVTVVVPPFAGSRTVQVPVTCSYDLEVGASRYFAALRDGDVPVELLFSGSVFYRDEDGALQVVRIGWAQEAEYRLPVAVWRATMDGHFPRSAWLRVGADAYARLTAYRAQGAFGDWDGAIGALLDGSGGERP